MNVILSTRGCAALLLCCQLIFVPFNSLASAEGTDHHKHSHQEHSGDGYSHSADNHQSTELDLSITHLADFGVTTAKAQAGVIQEQVTLPGQIRFNSEAIAHITPRFPAKILEVNARIGDSVRAGQVLARAESSETLAQFELKSLIDGQIIERHITLGEHLLASDNAFVVADMSSVWLDISLYPSQWHKVAKGQTVIITAAGRAAASKAQVDYVAPSIDQATRTGLARVFLNNSDGRWKPGMFVEAQINLSERPADLVIPRSAVIELEGESVVFVRTGDHLQPQTIALGVHDAQQVEVLDGLHPGSEYVSKGGFILKAHLQKSSFESGHNH